MTKRFERISSEIKHHFTFSKENYEFVDMKITKNQYFINVSCPNIAHNSYWVSWQHYKNRGDRCGKCRYINNGRKRLIYDTKKIYEIINEFGFELIKIHSIGVEGKITIKNKMGYIIDTKISNVMRSKPHFFHKNNIHTINNIKLWCLLNNVTFELISTKYIKSADNLIWKCLKCHGEFKRSWNTTQKNLFKCPYCVGTKASINNNLLLTNPNLSKQWDYIKNYPLCPEHVLPNLTKEFWWVCDKCEYEWLKSIHYRNQRNSPCPNCGMSKGEWAISSYLDDNNIKYHYEHSFEDCRHINKLRFDFYLPEHDICIEYQGEFHYMVIDGISNTNSLRKQITCDNIKRNFCQVNNIKLLEIPYWEYNNIRKLLSEICNLLEK